MIPVDQIDKLCSIVQDFAYSKFPKQSAILKGQFTRTVNQWAKRYGVQEARDTALNIVNLLWFASPENERLQLLLKRLTVGSLYEDNDTWGWHSAEQVQAERLPLTIKKDGDCCKLTVDFFGFGKDSDLWESRGFAPAMNFPYVRNDHPLLNSLIVSISQRDADFWEKHGYAMAEAFPYDRDEDALIVISNIKEFGFWKAWKWWAGCQEWYRDKHPEWFDNVYEQVYEQLELFN